MSFKQSCETGHLDYRWVICPQIVDFLAIMGANNSQAHFVLGSLLSTCNCARFRPPTASCSHLPREAATSATSQQLLSATNRHLLREPATTATRQQHPTVTAYREILGA